MGDEKYIRNLTYLSFATALVAAGTSGITAGITYAFDYAVTSVGYNSWNWEFGIAPITKAFKEMASGFFGIIDDALTYLFGIDYGRGFS